MSLTLTPISKLPAASQVNTSDLIAKVDFSSREGPETQRATIEQLIDLISANLPSGPSGTNVLFTTVTSVGPVDTSDETSLIGEVIGSNVIPANTISAGQVLRFTLSGTYNPKNNPVVNIKVKFNGNTYIDCGDGNDTFQLPKTANQPWFLNCLATFGSVGQDAQFIISGVFSFMGGDIPHIAIFGASDTARYVGNIDTTVDQTIDVTAILVDDTPNSLICDQAVVELLSPPAG